jgi:hypothetical protein
LLAATEGYLLRPIHAGFASFEALHRTELDLNDFAEMNEYLDVLDENRSRMQDWIDSNKGRR